VTDVPFSHLRSTSARCSGKRHLLDTVIARFDADVVADEVDKELKAERKARKQEKIEQKLDELEENSEILRQGFSK